MALTFPLVSLALLDRIGLSLGSLCEAGDIICLGGELGAGKTTLTRAIARGAGTDSQEYVCSPTFAFMHEYKGVVPLYHMDFYRLGSSDDVFELGLHEYFYASGITIIEWYERAENLIPPAHLLVRLELVDADNRRLTFSSPQVTWENRLAILEKICRPPGTEAP